MDIKYLLLLQDLREATGGVLNGFFEIVTKFGETAILVFALAIVYWSVDKRQGIYLALSFYANRVVNGFVKITACVYRPWIRDARVTPLPEAQADATGYSFPSGHSANASSFWGGLAVNKSYKPVWRILLLVMVLLIGFSRNYLGVHTPQDVLVSYVLAAIVLFAAAKLLEMVEKHPERDVWVLLGGVAMCVLLIIYAAVKSYPEDYDASGKIIVDGAKMAIDSFKNAGMGLGFFLGWFIERRFIRFSTDVNRVTRCVRYVEGIFIYEVLSGYATPALASAIGGGFGKALEQFVLVFYLIAAAPALFKLTDKLTEKKETKKP